MKATNINDLGKKLNKTDLSKKFTTKKALNYETPPVDEERVQEINLPSGGAVYPKDSYLADGKVKLRYMRGRDEDLFSNPDYSKEGIVLDMLIKHLCVDDDFEPNDLILADRLFVIISSRIMSLGSDVIVKDLVCPACEYKKESHNFKLEDIKEDNELVLPQTKHQNRYEIQLPVSGDTVAIQIPNGHMMRAFREILESMSSKTDRLYTLTSALSLIDAPVEDPNDLGQLLSYVDNLPIRDVKEIRRELNRIAGVTSAKIDYECDNCGYEDEFNVPLDETFFFPEI